MCHLRRGAIIFSVLFALGALTLWLIQTYSRPAVSMPV